MEAYRFAQEDGVPPHELFAAISGLPYSILLDSASPAHELGRYSFIAFRPFETIEAKNGIVTVSDAAGGRKVFHGDPFEILRGRMAAHAGRFAAAPPPGLPPFGGGAAGFFGYDLGRGLERLPATARDNPAIPDMAVGLYESVYAWDHERRRGEFIIHAADRSEAESRHRLVQDLLGGAKKQAAPFPGAAPSWTSTHTPDTYARAVEKTIEYICAGDIFQANISQRFSAALPEGFDAYAHYLALRKINPAPFAAFMNFGGVVLSSASPERFLSVTSGGLAETRPIKGTAPRGKTREEDEKNGKRLEASEKDRAENIMIVDLMRNDLSKVCRDESVEVKSLCACESFAAVHHLVSTVAGELRPGEDAASLLRACFPGGSVTGAPKIRAMEIIEEMEPFRRGPYCGATGYIGFDGAMDTAVAIRTLVYQGGGVSFNTGGGVTVDSDPAAEYRETMDKASAIFRSFAPPGNGDEKTEAS